MANFDRDVTEHMLTPLRHYWGGNHVVTNADIDATEMAYFSADFVPSGRCMHLTNLTGPMTLPVAKLGCSGNEKIPVHLFRDSDSPSIGVAGPDPTVSRKAAWSTGNNNEKRMLFFVGLEGFELATTEFRLDLATYKIGQYLRAPEIGDSAASPSAPADTTADAENFAGKLINLIPAETGPLINGADTIVGIVAPGVEPIAEETEVVDSFRNIVLPFFTTYRPPVQGLLAGTPVNVAR